MSTSKTQNSKTVVNTKSKAPGSIKSEIDSMRDEIKELKLKLSESNSAVKSAYVTASELLHDNIQLRKELILSRNSFRMVKANFEREKLRVDSLTRSIENISSKMK